MDLPECIKRVDKIFDLISNIIEGRGTKPGAPFKVSAEEEAPQHVVTPTLVTPVLAKMQLQSPAIVSQTSLPDPKLLLHQLRLARHHLTALQAEFPEQRYPNQESFRHNSTALKQYEAPLQSFHSSSEGALGLELESEFRGDIATLISLWQTFSSPDSVDTILVDNQALIPVDAPHRELLSELTQALSRAKQLLSINKTDQQFAAQHISEYELCLASLLTIEQLGKDCPHKTSLPTDLIQRLSITQSVITRIVENATVVVQSSATTASRVEPHRNFLQKRQYRSVSNQTSTTWNRAVSTRTTIPSPSVTTRLAEPKETMAASSTDKPLLVGPPPGLSLQRVPSDQKSHSVFAESADSVSSRADPVTSTPTAAAPSCRRSLLTCGTSPWLCFLTQPRKIKPTTRCARLPPPAAVHKVSNLLRCGSFTVFDPGGFVCVYYSGCLTASLQSGVISCKG